MNLVEQGLRHDAVVTGFIGQSPTRDTFHLVLDGFDNYRPSPVSLRFGNAGTSDEAGFALAFDRDNGYVIAGQARLSPDEPPRLHLINATWRSRCAQAWSPAVESVPVWVGAPRTTVVDAPLTGVATSAVATTLPSSNSPACSR